jgi:dephospho-CoA kinase
MPTEPGFLKIINKHVHRYPDMDCQDLVKLAYQSAFAGGHAIDDEEAAQGRIRAEYTSYDPPDSLPPLYESIGNNLFRLNLFPALSSGLSPETVSRLFVLTARQHTVQSDDFQSRLNVLRQAIQSGLLLTRPVRLEAFDRWIEAYQARGYPAVHHSERFRQAYRPAYRVLHKRFIKFLPLYCSIDQLMRTRSTVIVALDGNSGSGKSTLADTLHSVYGGNLFHMDDFFLRPEQKTPGRLKQTGGFIDYERFDREVVQNLAKPKPFSYRRYNCHTESMNQSVNVVPHRFNLVEGVYSLHPHLRSAYDLTVLLRIDPERQKARILERSGPELFDRFISDWIPRENRYFNTLTTADSCDLVFDV